MEQNPFYETAKVNIIIQRPFSCFSTHSERKCNVRTQIDFFRLDMFYSISTIFFLVLCDLMLRQYSLEMLHYLSQHRDWLKPTVIRRFFFVFLKKRAFMIGRRKILLSKEFHRTSVFSVGRHLLVTLKQTSFTKLKKF